MLWEKKGAEGKYIEAQIPVELHVDLNNEHDSS
jgi:hypothetical protein